MKVFGNNKWVGYLLAGILAAVMFLGGCAAPSNYYYNPPPETGGPARVVPDDPSFKYVTP